MVIAADDHRFLAAEQLQEMGIVGASILLEPVARNTAPAIAVGALQALRISAEALLLVLPADHLIGNAQSFAEAVSKARPQALAGSLVTFGIRPDRPETGFGYIRRGEALDSSTFRVDEFVEKPAARRRATVRGQWAVRLEFRHVSLSSRSLSRRVG